MDSADTATPATATSEIRPRQAVADMSVVIDPAQVNEHADELATAVSLTARDMSDICTHGPGLRI